MTDGAVEREEATNAVMDTYLGPNMSRDEAKDIVEALFPIFSRQLQAEIERLARERDELAEWKKAQYDRIETGTVQVSPVKGF